MTWNSQGNCSCNLNECKCGAWHLDEVKPCDSFNLLNEEEYKECFDWKNTQPLLHKENISKSNKIMNNYICLQNIKVYMFKIIYFDYNRNRSDYTNFGEKLLDCSYKKFIEWIESQWGEGMSWNNYKIKWSLIYKKEEREFNLNIEEDQFKYFNWTNVRVISL